MARFDFTGYLQQRDDAIERKKKAERDKQHQIHLTWVELSREAGNYVHRNGKRCSVESEFPTVTMQTSDGRRMLVTVRDRSTFGYQQSSEEFGSRVLSEEQPEEVSGDQAIMAAIVEWYEATAQPRVV
ncbi:hypothetical protein [Methylobacterium sp. 391_Methyba4]|uniref:hypothetical protein n=1 Tax=Methylobacterium sp. 391_Methyba4 TaxID=3038924 RepID=UPI00241E8F3C|nr:hypothetical protein [Methylobacterium sp. 391_Methyba4]WFS07662.1 hypothetical protein P9K36_30675 [Methylobacterium sp. 391_Methyba4]